MVGAIIAVVIGVLTAYRPSGFPPTLEARSLELGVASTQVILDVPRSGLVDPNVQLENVAARAPIYADLMTTEALTRPVARRANVPWSQISIAAAGGGEPGSEERSSQVLDEARGYSLLVKAGGGSPMISIFAQAPTGESAARLANAAAKELDAYVERLKGGQGLRESIDARQLGPARGGVVNSGVNKMVTVLATLGVFIAACLLILLGSSVAASYRRLRVSGQAWPQGGLSGAVPPNGDGSLHSDGQREAGTAQQESDLASVRDIRRR